MKKSILLAAILGAGLTAFSQQYVKQYFYTSGGSFSDANNKVKIAVIDGKTDKSIDSIKGNFSNAVKIYQDKVAKRFEGIAHIGRASGNDLIVRYDLDTYKMIDSVASSGVQAFARNQDKLVVVKGYASQNAKIDILNANDLSFVTGIPEITNDCSDVEIYGDSAFVTHSLPVKSGYPDSLGYVSIIDLRQNKLVKTISLGADAKGLSNLIIDKQPDGKLHIYYSNFGNGQLESVDNLIFHSIKGSQTLDVTDSKIFGIKKTNPSLTAIDINKLSNDTLTHITQVVSGFVSCEYDTINNLYLILKTDYATYGKLIRYSVAENKAIDSVNVGTTTVALDIDYRQGLPLGFESFNASTSKTSVYPNPCKHVLNIQNNTNASDWKILNLQGQVIESGLMNSLEEKISTENFAKGVYFLQLSGNATTSSTKFVKE
jgi:hypothetical protein